MKQLKEILNSFLLNKNKDTIERHIGSFAFVSNSQIKLREEYKGNLDIYMFYNDSKFTSDFYEQIIQQYRGSNMRNPIFECDSSFQNFNLWHVRLAREILKKKRFFKNGLQLLCLRYLYDQSRVEGSGFTREIGDLRVFQDCELPDDLKTQKFIQEYFGNHGRKDREKEDIIQ